MIEKMKKLTFLVYHREYEDFLYRLQDLGVMHVVTGEVNPQQSEKISGYVEQIKTCTALKNEMTDLLAQAGKKDEKSQLSNINAVDSEFNVSLLSEHFEHLAELRRKEAEQATQLSQLEPWGDFNPTEVRDKMQAAGCEFQFYVLPTKTFKKEIDGEFPVMVVSEAKKNTYFVFVARDAQETLPATRVTLPEISLSSLKAEHTAVVEELKKETEALTKLSKENLPRVEETLRVLNAKMQFDTVKEGSATAAANYLMVLNGWFPAVKQAELEQAFSDDAAWYEICDPTPEDDIPICLKNNRFFKLFEMFTELYMLPKYNELDLTPFLAPFYIIFFGLCLGDSGYGLFIVLASLAVKFFAKDLSQGMRAAMNLLLTLGISAFFCGLLSGAFFGFNLYELNVPFFDKVGSVVALDNSQMFNLSLILGFIQIIFGMCLKSYNRIIQLGFTYSLSTIGWMLVILSLAVTLLMPEYGDISKWFTYAGLALAFLVNSPGRYKKNPVTGLLINVGSGLWDAYNTATGMLGDMLSYVRLFALGLSGGILATVFDSLATGLAPDNAILGPIVMVLIFVLGHALNMFMNVLGAFVHPMRLTFVEFFKNSGYEGGGLAYTPFKNS